MTVTTALGVLEQLLGRWSGRLQPRFLVKETFLCVAARTRKIILVCVLPLFSWLRIVGGQSHLVNFLTIVKERDVFVRVSGIVPAVIVLD